MLSADNFCNQFGPRLGPLELDPICSKLRWYSWKNFRKSWFWKKNQQTTKKHENFPGGKELKINVKPRGILFIQLRWNMASVNAWKTIMILIFHFITGPVALSTTCKLIAPGVAINGLMSITKTDMYFEMDEEDDENKKIDPKVGNSRCLV